MKIETQSLLFDVRMPRADELPAPERIRQWAQREFNAKYVEAVTQDLVDVASGNRPGNVFERQALDAIFPEWSN